MVENSTTHPDATKHKKKHTISDLVRIIDSMRTELRTDRTELRADIDSMRTEMRTDRTELRADIDSMRAEMRGLFTKQTIRINSLKDRVTDIETRNVFAVGGAPSPQGVGSAKAPAGHHYIEERGDWEYELPFRR